MTLSYPLPVRRQKIPFDQVLSKSYWTWRTNPALMVPTLLSSSISVLSQSIYVIFGTALLLELESSGTLAQITTALTSGNPVSISGILLSTQLLLPLAEYMGLAFVVSTVFSILAGGFAYSAEYNSYAIALGGSRVGITRVMSTMKSKWREMAWTYFLVQFFTYLPLALLVLLTVNTVIAGGASLSLILAFFSFGIVAAILSVLAAFFFMYSLVLVAIGDASGFGALAISYGMAKSHFGVSLTYAIVRILSYILISVIANVASGAGLPLSSLASIAITLLLVPVLHMAKTEVYLQMRNPSDITFAMYGPMSSTKDLLGGPFFRFAFRKLKQGLGELKRFVFNIYNVPYHLASAASLAVGVYVGAFVATHGLIQAILGLEYTEGQINPTILSDIPLSTGFDIFLHNWLVSLSTALSGMWLIAPSLVTLAFNGMILGVVFYLTPNFTMFAAAIFPHGSIEIPSFVLAGSAGMRLGVAFIRSLGKGADSIEEGRFYLVARQTIYVVIGLVVLFFIAGLIEGNITPVIMRMYGWK